MGCLGVSAKSNGGYSLLLPVELEEGIMVQFILLQIFASQRGEHELHFWRRHWYVR